MSQAVAASIGLVAVAAIAPSLAGCGVADDAPTPPSLVMRVPPALRHSGGTVVLLPHPVAPTAQSRAIHVVPLADDFSYVSFDYPADTRWSVRFLAFGADPGRRGDPMIATKLLTVGTTDNGNGPKQDFDIFHIYGAKINERVSYARGTDYDKIRDRGTTCHAFPGAQVCVPRDKTLPHYQTYNRRRMDLAARGKTMRSASIGINRALG